ncbi:branched-chain amino acid ABC transporter permease [Candidatus Izimaplasma bacterium ZiA1]|uniref:branched-chain amino acid ABC transporter permease n=1 Tax=Candidatus Izimoplasma sp. ZiA1 TaxID=2024899 RepID=UPI00143AD885
MTYLKQLYKTSYPFRFLLFGIVLSFLPLLSDLDIIEFSALTTWAQIIIFAVVALGLNLLLGFSGLISLSTAGFMGFGAYTITFLSNRFDLPFMLAILITLAIAAAIGVFIGLLSLRVEGIYLAIATLFVGEILQQIYKQVDWFSGGFSGVRFHYPQFNLIFTTIELTRNQTFIFLVACLVLVMTVIYNIINSRTGRALMAMSRSEHAAQAMGINILKYRLVAFVTSTVIASFSGILYASFMRGVEPTTWNLNLSLFIIAMVVVGGYKSIFGMFLGAFVIHGIPTFWLNEMFASIPGFAYIFSGVLIIVIIMFYSVGLIHIHHDIKKLYLKIKPYVIKAYKKLFTKKQEKGDKNA